MDLPGMLVAYDDDYNIIATLDYRVVYDESDPDRPPIGIMDFAAMEAAGTELTVAWQGQVIIVRDEERIPARGSKAWPEWIGGRALEFRAELEGEPGSRRIVALVHKRSGYRRERAVLQERIRERQGTAPDGIGVLWDLVGGPNQPLALNDEGETVGRGALLDSLNGETLLAASG